LESAIRIDIVQFTSLSVIVILVGAQILASTFVLIVLFAVAGFAEMSKVAEPSAISQEEFQRLQTQLLDLRSANYTLMEESNRYKNDMKNALIRLESIEKDNQKLQRIQEKSRKAKDVEMLFAENDVLQKKLHSQEEEFRLQNQTLMNELTLLVTSNDKLESIIKNQKLNGVELPETSTSSSQCDLSTEHFEKCIREEKCRSEQLKVESSSKDDLLEALNLKLNETTNNCYTEIQQLKDELNKLQVEAEQIPILSDKLERSHTEVKDAEVELIRLKAHIEEIERKAQDRIDQLKEAHQQEIDDIRLSCENEVKGYEIQVELMSAQKTEFEEDAARCRQEALDAQEDVRIAERRITSITADLRRQLRGERRRADKLQERLRDFVSDASFQFPKSSETSVDADNCSVSSWSLMSGQNEANNAPATSSSPYPITNSPSSGSDRTRSRADVEQPSNPDLMTENSRLVARLATMQQEKWRIEERVSHLEESSAAMADELMKRGKLIQHYCMDSRIHIHKPDNVGSAHLIAAGEKMSVRRMVSLIRQIGSDSDTETDTQRRLQRMLEETLTKNMHLQEDVERLSQEIVRLSQIVGSANLN